MAKTKASAGRVPLNAGAALARARVVRGHRRSRVERAAEAQHSREPAASVRRRPAAPVLPSTAAAVARPRPPARAQLSALVAPAFPNALHPPAPLPPERRRRRGGCMRSTPLPTAWRLQRLRRTSAIRRVNDGTRVRSTTWRAPARPRAARGHPRFARAGAATCECVAQRDVGGNRPAITPSRNAAICTHFAVGELLLPIAAVADGGRPHGATQ